MIKITRRQFLTYLAGVMVAVKLPVAQPEILSVIKVSESAADTAKRLWQHPTLSYWYSEDGGNWKQQVYHSITLPFSDGIVTLDSQLTNISTAFMVAKRRVTHFDHMQLGIDWPKERFHVPK